jgi:hypothetical protein
MAQANTFINVQALIVWPAMHDHVAHALKHRH